MYKYQLTRNEDNIYEITIPAWDYFHNDDVEYNIIYRKIKSSNAIKYLKQVDAIFAKLASKNGGNCVVVNSDIERHNKNPATITTKKNSIVREIVLRPLITPCVMTGIIQIKINPKNSS